jgi:Mrp family chromosome partitioning ATPase
MGRMLEALKSTGATRSAVKDKPFFEDALEHGPAADYATPPDDAIPFIEVGPNKKIEGSAQVMAVKHPGQSRVQPPHQPVEKIAQIQPLHAELTPAKPMGVVFEPWPALPRLHQGIAAEIITFHQPEHPISKQYAGMIAKMREEASAPRPQVVLLAGGRAQAGASTVLLNLAVAATLAGKNRVVVVDAHLRRPCLAQRLGYAAATGLQEVLEGKFALEQAVVPTAIAGLHLIAAQAGPAAIRMRAEAVRWLLAWLRDHFELVLIDAPPLGDDGDLPILAPACDAGYLVVPEEESPQSQKALGQALTSMGARVRGFFHTR